MEAEEKKKLCVDVGQRVWRCRTEAGMTKEILAEKLGITSQYVNEIEQGKKCMSMSIFVQLGQVFHISLDTLANGAQTRDVTIERLIHRLADMTPLDRDLAAHMILTAAKAVEEMGRED